MRKRLFYKAIHGFFPSNFGMQLVSNSQLAKRGLLTVSTLLNLGTSQSDIDEAVT